MMGKVMKVRVVGGDAGKKRLQLSARLTDDGSSAEAAPATSTIPAGSSVSGMIASISGTVDAPEDAFAIIRIMDKSGKTTCLGSLPLLQCGDSVDEAKAAFAALKASKRIR